MKKTKLRKESPLETQKAIFKAKEEFERALADKLSLTKARGPRFLEKGTGLQDDLAGTQEPVSFETKFTEVEIVHSLAKWKRHTLGEYKVEPGQGIYTEMHAIRKEEDVSDVHSIYVDQWDWEKVIQEDDRNLDFLKETVRDIYGALKAAHAGIPSEYRRKEELPEKIKFFHAEELEKTHPELSPAEREDAIAEEHGAVFLVGIGHPLESGEPHGLRAADYDDWSTKTEKGRGLNGDIILWDSQRGEALEISSMGIRVDPEALEKQLEMHGLADRKDLPFHKGILEGEIPLTIGGGIGQSRTLMYLLGKEHIAEVQPSVWPQETRKELSEKGLSLL